MEAPEGTEASAQSQGDERLKADFSDIPCRQITWQQDDRRADEDLCLLRDE